jgi:transcriptional regulator with XRE-family HTH domain
MRDLTDTAQFLRAERTRQRLSQRGLASSAGISFRTYQRLESGDPGSRLSSLLRALAALGYELRAVAARRPTLDELNEIYGHEDQH